MTRLSRRLPRRADSPGWVAVTILAIGGVVVGGIVLGLALRPLTQAHEAEAARVIPDDLKNVLAPAPAAGTSPQSAVVTRANGIEVSVKGVRFGSGQVVIDTCFDMPDNSDWVIYGALVQQGGKSLAYLGSAPIEVVELPSNGIQRSVTWAKDGSHSLATQSVPPATAIQAHRCDALSFDGYVSSQGSPSITYTVSTILAYPREGEVCDPTYMAKVQRTLDARKLGIIVGCSIETLQNGGGVSGLTVVSKPNSMSSEQAQELLSGNDLFVEVNGIRGPWIFELPGK